MCDKYLYRVNYPNDELKPFYNCDICGQEIVEGEEYIENYSGYKGHKDCFWSIKQLAKWLGYEVKVAGEE